MNSVLEELAWRGLISQSTDLDQLSEAMDAGPITFYTGIDPSAPSPHMGNLLILVMARHLQKAGHRPIYLVGGSTGLVGDPKDSGDRPLSDPAVVAEYVERIERQAAPLLDFTGDNAALIVNNLDWTKDLTLLEFLRDVGRVSRLSTMLRKDKVATRLESGEGMSYAEFSYQLLQGMDFRHLYREHGCILQLGGQDQWGNLISGVDLIHYTEPDAKVHVLTAPLMTDASGKKFGKSEGNAVWLDPEMTSPYAWYQYWLGVEDASVVKLLKAFTDLPREEIMRLEQAVAEEPFRREAQKALADSMTVLVHGEEELAAAKAASEAVFGKGSLVDLPEKTLLDATRELPGADVAPGTSLVDALVSAGLAESRNAARRLLGDGGVSVNGTKVSDTERVLDADDFLHGRVAVLRRGRKAQAVARLAQG